MTDISHWETNDLNQLLTLLVGKTYGNEPEKHLTEIQKIKCYEAENIIRDLRLQKTDCVLDLGSGCGFIADHISSLVNKVSCVDISDSFLSYAKRVNQKNSNIEFYKIEPAILELVPQSTAIYSTAVFIHFNIYDVYLYLLACYQNLFSGGKMLFDFLNDQKLDIKNSRWARHAEAYKKDRQRLFVNLHYHSEYLIKTIAQDIGFQVQWTRTENDQIFILLNKP